MYKHASGAIVFGAGTVQWGWALDPVHDSEAGIPANLVNHLNIRVGTDILAPVVAIQQFTVNFLADMGAQPASLAASLRLATPSNDFVKPTCLVDSVAAGPDGTFVVHVIAGDNVGVVAAVEVRAGSSDRWHPMSLASDDGSAWTYSFTAMTAPTAVWCRATDDSLNVGLEGGTEAPMHHDMSFEKVPSNFVPSEEVEL
jgi:hypothetical protein